MASVLSGFADSAAWARREDGTIVGRARDRSYKEVARDGVPIDVLVWSYVEPAIKSSVDDETLLATLPHPTTGTCRCDVCAYAERYGAPLEDPDDFEQYLVAVEPRSVARARPPAAPTGTAGSSRARAWRRRKRCPGARARSCSPARRRRPQSPAGKRRRTR